MSLVDVPKDYEPRVNPDRYQKPLVGDAVAEIDSIDEVEVKKGQSAGQRKTILKATVINNDPSKGREGSTIEPGDEVLRWYSNDREKDMKKLLDDLFTAGIAVDRTSEETVKESFDAAKGQKIYVRCWMADKMKLEEDPNTGESEWVKVPGAERSVQKVAIKSKALIKPEYEVAQLPF